MYWLARRTSNGADGEGLGRILGTAVIACCDSLLDDLDLPIEARGPTFYQRHVGSQTHLIDMPSRLHIVQRIENNIETAKPVHIELCLLDVRMMCLDLDARIELLRSFFGHQCLGLLDVFVTEKELSVQVAQVNGVEVDDVNFAESKENEVLEELAADAAGAHHQYSRL